MYKKTPKRTSKLFRKFFFSFVVRIEYPTYFCPVPDINRVSGVKTGGTEIGDVM